MVTPANTSSLKGHTFVWLPNRLIRQGEGEVPKISRAGAPRPPHDAQYLLFLERGAFAWDEDVPGGSTLNFFE